MFGTQQDGFFKDSGGAGALENTFNIYFNGTLIDSFTESTEEDVDINIFL